MRESTVLKSAALSSMAYAGAISMREAARIQSFPDDFIFDAKLRETERQIGNAVPPVLAWHIAKAIAACLK